MAAVARNPYDVLGVAKTAAEKDIKSAFRKLAKAYHPDKNPGDPKAKDAFNAANQAYEILGDDKKRKAFDRGEIDNEGKPAFDPFAGAHSGAHGDPFSAFRQGRGPGGGQYEFRSSGGGAEDIFSQFFGDAFGGASAQARRPATGQDIQATLGGSVEEMAGAEKLSVLFPNGKRLSVKLPAYVEDGQTIRLKGQGEAGPAGAGDALVRITLKAHPRYRVEGRDLHVDLPLQLKDAVLGAAVPVETPYGKVGLKVPAWSSSDKVMRLKGKGLPTKTGHGDLLVHVRVMLPAAPDAALEKLMKEG